MLSPWGVLGEVLPLLQIHFPVHRGIALPPLPTVQRRRELSELVVAWPERTDRICC